MKGTTLVAILALLLTQIYTSLGAKNENLCRLNSTQLASLDSALDNYPRRIQLHNLTAEIIPVPVQVCLKKLNALSSAINELIENGQKCGNEESTACIDVMHEKIDKHLNELNKRSDDQTRRDLRELGLKLERLYKNIKEWALLRSSPSKIGQYVRDKIRAGDFEEAASFLTNATADPRNVDKYEEIVQKLELKNLNFKAMLLFAKVLGVSPISLNVVQDVSNNMRILGAREPEILYFYYILESTVENKEFGQLHTNIRQKYNNLRLSLFEYKKRIIPNLLNTEGNYTQLLEIETFFAPQKLEKLLPDITYKSMEQDFATSMRQLITVASSLGDAGNQCILMESVNERIQLRKNKNASSLEAFHLWLFTRKTVDEESGFKSQELVYRKKCVDVQNELESYATKHFEDYFKMFKDGPPWRPFLSAFYAYPITMKWLIPDLIEHVYNGDMSNLRKLIKFYKEINNVEDSILFLFSLAERMTIFEDKNTFESFQIFVELKSVMSLAYYDEVRNIFKKKSRTAKVLAPNWIENLLWNKTTTNCKLTNRFNGEQLFCSDLLRRDFEADDFNSIFTTAGKGADAKWSIKIEPQDGQLIFQNHLHSESYLHHGKGLRMPLGTRDGWKGWSRHEDEKWKIEGVAGNYVKLFYADGIYLTGSSRKCNPQYSCVEMKRSTKDHLQMWRIEC